MKRRKYQFSCERHLIASTLRDDLYPYCTKYMDLNKHEKRGTIKLYPFRFELLKLTYRRIIDSLHKLRKNINHILQKRP